MRPLRLARVFIDVVRLAPRLVLVLLPAVGQGRPHRFVRDPEELVEVLALHAQYVARVVADDVVHAMLGHGGWWA